MRSTAPPHRIQLDIPTAQIKRPVRLRGKIQRPVGIQKMPTANKPAADAGDAASEPFNPSAAQTHDTTDGKFFI
ncbi:MAG: hypothetical protein HDKAJFGB_02764 [Anaerolineae bacterium]|nr:hypothetical protein [Anaerolineae bacterium]